MVNIKDIEEFEKKPEISYKDIIKQIFERQKELLIKYRDIEGIPVQVNINDASHQKLLKEFTFRGIEELAEAYEGFLDNDLDHFIEEVSDSLHFFTEVMLMVGIDYDKVISVDNFTGEKELDLSMVDVKFWDITYLFSIACNKLKNKPWAKSQFITDENEYRKCLIEAYNSYLEQLNDIGFSGKQLLDIYINKHMVNKFRIRSNY